MSAFTVTGTDTDVGKTVFAAARTGALDAHYWKPVQAGLDEGGDRAQVAKLAGLPETRVLPEAYRLATPCSPHRAAEIDGVAIDVSCSSSVIFRRSTITLWSWESTQLPPT